MLNYRVQIKYLDNKTVKVTATEPVEMKDTIMIIRGKDLSNYIIPYNAVKFIQVTPTKQ
jgi:hypothetical protein